MYELKNDKGEKVKADLGSHAFNPCLLDLVNTHYECVLIQH